MSLVTISSIAAFEGAQTRIFFSVNAESIEMMPLMVWVFPVPAKLTIRRSKGLLTRTLNQEEVPLVLDSTDGWQLRLIEMVFEVSDELLDLTWSITLGLDSRHVPRIQNELAVRLKELSGSDRSNLSNPRWKWVKEVNMIV